MEVLSYLIQINADSDKYIYSRYGIGFDSCSEFSLSEGSVVKNISFWSWMNSSVNIDDKKKKAQYGISFSRSNRTFCLCLDYNESNSFFYLLMLKKHIIWKQNIPKYKNSLCKKIFQKMFQLITLKKQH